ncbi:hypothetical protein [Pseudomonas rhodesiae]|uniref:hypothetical protein n=1 Tax=Pseudomonas rhodesiae TaxID=76760 RepID=UPI000FF2A227|nr:hypothetical protein [Pseudomonas rhodesiae]ROM50799.1 hypothetical protein BK650_19335 [Pseudomonas rhodesiae]ROM61437.1 hypothetical protein BK651_23515 [Pseudomonas rhodesiae]
MRGSLQSALSRLIQLLETRLGAALIDNHSKNPIHLTIASQALLPNALEHRYVYRTTVSRA